MPIETLVHRLLWAGWLDARDEVERSTQVGEYRLLCGRSSA